MLIALASHSNKYQIELIIIIISLTIESLSTINKYISIHTEMSASVLYHNVLFFSSYFTEDDDQLGRCVYDSEQQETCFCDCS
jgi:hypothetical protein